MSQNNIPNIIKPLPFLYVLFQIKSNTEKYFSWHGDTQRFKFPTTINSSYNISGLPTVP